MEVGEGRMVILVLSIVVGVVVLGGLGLWLRSRRPESPRPVRRSRAAELEAMDLTNERVSVLASTLSDVDAALLWFAMGKGRTPPTQEELPAVVARALQRIEDGVLSGETLPRRPQLLPQLMGTLNAPGSNAAALAAIIGQDPALSASLLRIANSAAFRRSRQPMDNLERVVVKVGNEGLENLLASALVQPVLELEDSDHRRMAAVLWRHGQLASSAAADHARRVQRIDPLPLHLVALLPALANLLVVRSLARLSNQPLDDAGQLQLLQRSQYGLSSEIAARWELPADMVKALQQQQGPAWESLQFGRRFAWAWMQVEQGQHTAAEAREALSTAAPQSVVEAIWHQQEQKIAH